MLKTGLEGGLEGILRSRTDERPTETEAEEEKQKEEVIDCPFRVIWSLKREGNGRQNISARSQIANTIFSETTHGTRRNQLRIAMWVEIEENR